MALSIKKCFAVLALNPKFVIQDQAYYVIGDKKEYVSTFYFSEIDAKNYAEEIAAKNPKVPVLLLTSVAVFEAKKPETTKKEFKDNGELIPSRD